MLEIDRQGPVQVVHWSDGENRFNPTSLAALHGLLDDLEATEGPLAVVLTGAGKFFSNGLDLDWMGANAEQAGDVVAGVHRLFRRVMALDAVTVAAVNGHCFAAGAMLATCFDVVVMREDRGFWCLPEADLGLPLTESMFAVLDAKLPKRAAQEAILTARRYGGADAARLGLIHEAAAEDQVLPRAVAIATELAGKDRKVTAVHKRQLFGAALDVLDGQSG